MILLEITKTGLLEAGITLAFIIIMFALMYHSAGTHIKPPKDKD